MVKVVTQCLVHHHLRNYPLPTPVDYDPSTANNGECLIDLLLEYNFDFIIHGHRHHSFLDTRKDIPILCAGSFSATIESCWEGLVFNQFHLVDMTKDACQSTMARGHVYSWLNTAAGWRKSYVLPDGCILGPQSPFGVSLKRHREVSEKLKIYISQNLGSHDVISWKNNVLSNVPELSFITEDIETVIGWCRENMPDVVVKKDSVDIIQFVRK